MSPKLDLIDLRILRELMADGRLTNVALSKRAGISAPPCLRRVRALEQSGLISGYHADVDVERLGFSVTAYVMVTLHNQAERDLRAFEDRALGWAMVREAHMLSGESDYILKCVARDLTAFQDFLLNTVSATPNVASVKTNVAIRRVKYEPGVALTAG
ncbi:MAG: Lrp/AsnC family transcriptional regulator [Pseudomonadota bacterium]